MKALESANTWRSVFLTCAAISTPAFEGLVQIINFSTKELKKHLYQEHRDFDGRAQQVSAVQETGSTDEEKLCGKM